jgi:hypothetical protein
MTQDGAKMALKLS